MARARFDTAFAQQIRAVAPGVPAGPLPTTLGGLGQLLLPPGASPRGINRAIAQTLLPPGASELQIRSQMREVQRYRAAEGTAPRGGRQARGNPNLLARVRERVRAELAERATAELRRRGVTMAVEGDIVVSPPNVEERSLPEIRISGELLSLPWTDVEGNNHLAPLDALAAGDMEEAAAGFDAAYYAVYGMPEGTFTLDVQTLDLALG